MSRNIGRMRIQGILFTLMLVAAWMMGGTIAPAAAASTITVSTCDAQSVHDAISSASSGDTIDFSCSGTITLGYADYEFLISKNLTFDGAGQSVTFDGHGSTSMFFVTQSASLTLKNLTFVNGIGGTYSQCDTCDQVNYGGVITNEGPVTIENSTFSNNQYTGLIGGGVILSTLTTLTVSNSTFNGNSTHAQGAGILSLLGTLNVTDSTFSNNTVSEDGGGISIVSGTATISGSTFNGNTADAWAGDGSGAGLSNNGTTTITNSTFSGNNAEAGGAIANTGDLTIVNSTIVGNHANWWANGILNATRDGIFLALGGTVTIKNSILANGPARDGDGTFNFGGNCVTNGTTNNGGGSFDDDGTCGVSQVSKDDLKLGSLADNGGPTKTIALGSGSVAINVDTCSPSVPTDQRGYTRATSGSTCDAGAYEFGAVNPIKSTAMSSVSGSGTYGGTATLTATLTSSGTPVSGVSVAFKLNGSSVGSSNTNGSGVATLSNVSLSGISGGSHSNYVAASFAGNSSYSSSNASGTLSVAQASQTISFDLSTLPAKAFGDSPFDISSYASASSSLTVAFTSSTNPVCTVSGSSVTILTSGVCTITASQPGDTNYTAATDVQQSFDVADKTPPTTTASATNADTSAYTFDSWTHQAVTVSLSAVDAGGSGVASTFISVDGAQQTYTSPVMVTGEGTHTVDFWSTDNAGNEETPHQSKSVKIDTTVPSISGTATISANGNGWYKTAVTIHWTCSDALSGIATCPIDQVISGEGANQTVTGTATDNAGNSTTVDSSPVNIDLTAPTISGAPTTSPNGNGWYDTPVTIHWTCSDALSGIETCPSDSVISSEGSSQTAAGTAVDQAGNSTTVDSPAVKIDMTAPSINGTPTTSPNGNDWYNTSVTIHWTCSDAVSGVATCPSDQTISGEGAGQTVSGTATDNAGNSATVDSSPVSIDLTPPTVTYSGNKGTYTVDQTVTITCTASDALSGIDTTTCADITGPAYSFAVGINNLGASATDKAGNTADGSVSFTVVVTPDSLANLTNRFESNAAVRYQLQHDLTGIRIAMIGHVAFLKSLFVSQYDSTVNSQRGRTLTNEQADTLIALAKAL